MEGWIFYWVVRGEGKGGEKGKDGRGEGRQVMLGPRLGTGRERRADARFTHPTQPRTHTDEARTIPNTETARGILTHGIPVVGPRDGSAGNVAGVKSASQEPVPRGHVRPRYRLRGIRSNPIFASLRFAANRIHPSPLLLHLFATNFPFISVLTD